MYKLSLALFLLLVTNYANAVVVNSSNVEQMITVIIIGLFVVPILAIFIAAYVRSSDKKNNADDLNVKSGCLKPFIIFLLVVVVGFFVIVKMALG